MAVVAWCCVTAPYRDVPDLRDLDYTQAVLPDIPENAKELVAYAESFYTQRKNARAGLLVQCLSHGVVTL